MATETRDARRSLRLTRADGMVVGYADVGDPEGKPVLYLHGTPSSRLETSGHADERARAAGVRLLAPDRPGIGLSSFSRYGVAAYPELVEWLADSLGIQRFAVVGLSGGARYACACAWRLRDRITRAVVVSGTCSPDLPGAKEAWTKQDRRAYFLADRAPLVFRLFLSKMARDLRRGDPSSLLSAFPELPPADRRALEDETTRTTLVAAVREALRQGPLGPAHDYRLEARPWEIPLGAIKVPVEVWHGEADTIVPIRQGQLVADAIPGATTRYFPDEGHISLVVDRFEDILRSAVAP